MAADVLVGLAGAGASLLGNALNSASSSRAASQAFSRQKELLALQQQYYDHNWQRDANYNDPRSQMSRLKAAGLNPNLVYGNGVQGMTDPSTPMSAAGAAPMAVTTPGNLGAAVSDAVNAAVGIQQAKKAKSETIANDIENQYNLSVLGERIKAVGLANKWTEAQIKQAKEQTALLAQEYNKVTAEINVMSTNREVFDKTWKERFEKEMREYDDKHKLSQEEWKRLRDTYDSFVELSKNNADKSKWDALLQKFVYDSDNDFKNFERSLGIFGAMIKIASKLLSSK